jgi:glycolate oxidase iron-sulfur subunit
MPRVKVLAQLVKELEAQLALCMRCGLCQAVCPLFAETGREADVARGKLALLDGLAREIFQNPQGVQDRLARCLLCGACAANCPSGVKVLDIFIKARAILTGYLGLSPVKKALFRGLLRRPGFFNLVLDWGARFQGIFVKPVDDLLGSSCSRFLSPLLKGRHFKPLAPAAFHRLVPARQTEPGPGGIKAAFFVGCLIDKIFPEVAGAVLKSLEYHGVGVFLPPDQACCGIPALSGGDTATYDKLVRHNLALFASEPFDYLVTACATCTATIKKMWPLMALEYSPDEKAQIEAMQAKVMDIGQFLVEKVGLAEGIFSEEEKILITYHDPCHLKKSLGVAAQPRALLRAHPRFELKEIPEADWCCGCGGSFNLQHYDVSLAIGQRKRENIIKTKAAVVATGCPACMLQITDLLSRAGDRIRVKHTVEIYADALQDLQEERPVAPAARKVRG